MTVLGLGRARRGGLAKESLTGNLFSFQPLSLAPSTGLAGLALLAALAPACDSHEAGSSGRNQPPPLASGPADLRGIAKLLGLDAGELETPVDPPAPAGDLKVDMDRFTSVDECALERARLDPLVGDALEAIGYDTFLRDACRVIDAAKAKDASRCAEIDASSLAARCRATVAQVAGTPDACPWESMTHPARGRDPRCLAVSSRDVRLCAAVSDPVERATCQAMLARDDRPCAALQVRAARSRCTRDADRWRGILASASPGAGSGTHDTPLAVTGRLHADRIDHVDHVDHVDRTDRTDAAQTLDLDLAPDLAHGVTVVQQRDGARLVLGPLSEAGLDFVAPSPHVRGSLALELFAASGPRGAGPTVRIERAELVVPGRPPLATPGAQSSLTAKLDRLDAARATPIAVVVDGDISAAGSSWRVHAEATTFVRDVVQTADLYGGASRARADGDGGMR
jgi:hypothetical protein